MNLPCIAQLCAIPCKQLGHFPHALGCFAKGLLVKNFQIWVSARLPCSFWLRSLNSLFIFFTDPLSDFSRILYTKIVIHPMFSMIDQNSQDLVFENGLVWFRSQGLCQKRIYTIGLTCQGLLIWFASARFYKLTDSSSVILEHLILHLVY